MQLDALRCCRKYEMNRDKLWFFPSMVGKKKEFSRYTLKKGGVGLGLGFIILD